MYRIVWNGGSARWISRRSFVRHTQMRWRLCWKRSRRLLIPRRSARLEFLLLPSLSWTGWRCAGVTARSDVLESLLLLSSSWNGRKQRRCYGKIWGLNLCRYRSCHGLDESSTGVTARSDAAYDVWSVRHTALSIRRKTMTKGIRHMAKDTWSVRISCRMWEYIGERDEGITTWDWYRDQRL